MLSSGGPAYFRYVWSCGVGVWALPAGAVTQPAIRPKAGIRASSRGAAGMQYSLRSAILHTTSDVCPGLRAGALRVRIGLPCGGTRQQLAADVLAASRGCQLRQALGIRRRCRIEVGIGRQSDLQCIQRQAGFAAGQQLAQVLVGHLVADGRIIPGTGRSMQRVILAKWMAVR